jgi:hypothetical protein
MYKETLLRCIACIDLHVTQVVERHTHTVLRRPAVREAVVAIQLEAVLALQPRSDHHALAWPQTIRLRVLESHRQHFQPGEFDFEFDLRASATP